MWNYFCIFLVTIATGAISGDGASTPYEAYPCPDGKTSKVIVYTLFNYVDAKQHCKTFSGRSVDFGSATLVFVQEHMCNARLGPGPYWISSCITMESKKIVNNIGSCNTKMAFPVCEVRGQLTVTTNDVPQSTTKVTTNTPSTTITSPSTTTSSTSTTSSSPSTTTTSTSTTTSSTSTTSSSPSTTTNFPSETSSSPSTTNNSQSAISSSVTSRVPNISLSNTVTTTPVYFESCNNEQDWYTVDVYSYCISRYKYTHTEAISFCTAINSSLIDLDFISNPIDVIDHLFDLNTFQTGTEFWTNNITQRGQFSYVDHMGMARIVATPNRSEQHMALCMKDTGISIPNTYSPTVQTYTVTRATVVTTDSTPTSSSVITSPFNSSVLSPSPIITSPSSSSALSPSPVITSPSSSSVLSPSPVITSLTSSSALQSSPSITSSTRSSALPAFPLISPMGNSASTPPNQGQSWITVGQSEYLLDMQRRTYISASDHCHSMKNASLIHFLTPVSYFQAFSKLHITDFSYWIKAGTQTMTNDSKCVVFHGNNRTMSTLPCGNKLFSVCKRSIYGNDTDQPLHHPQFIQLLREMTIDKSETVVNKRKLLSADDRRTSAKTAGGLGVFLLCSIIFTMLILDLTRIRY